MYGAWGPQCLGWATVGPWGHILALLTFSMNAGTGGAASHPTGLCGLSCGASASGKQATTSCSSRAHGASLAWVQWLACARPKGWVT